MIDHATLLEALKYIPDRGVFVWVKPYPRHANRTGLEAGTPHLASRGKFYHELRLGGRNYKRSRLAWFYMTGSWPAQQIDHINGNSLDDRWENLREATPLQNAQNIKCRKRATALPMGVRLLKGRFQARIGVNRKLVHLGCFATPTEASDVYQHARRRFYGEFA